MQYLDAISKNDGMISVHFQGKQFKYHGNPRNTEEAEVEQFYEDLQDLLEQQKMMTYSFQGTGMPKQEVKKYLE